MPPLIVCGPAKRLLLAGALVGCLFVGFQRRQECHLGEVRGYVSTVAESHSDLLVTEDGVEGVKVRQDLVLDVSKSGSARLS
jgi:hypothetical protein